MILFSSFRFLAENYTVSFFPWKQEKKCPIPFFTPSRLSYNEPSEGGKKFVASCFSYKQPLRTNTFWKISTLLLLVKNFVTKMTSFNNDLESVSLSRKGIYPKHKEQKGALLYSSISAICHWLLLLWFSHTKTKNKK